MQESIELWEVAREKATRLHSGIESARADWNAGVSRRANKSKHIRIRQFYSNNNGGNVWHTMKKKQEEAA
jgi:hypothetical protein